MLQNSATITLSVCDGLYDRLTNAVCQIFLLSGAGVRGALAGGQSVGGVGGVCRTRARVGWGWGPA